MSTTDEQIGDCVKSEESMRLQTSVSVAQARKGGSSFQIMAIKTDLTT